MKAMLFAAGMGTRLKPLTDTMPKALVPVNGRPLLEHTITRLCHNGVTEVVVNVHHFASQIIDYIKTHHFDCVVKISDESDELLDTGGGLKKAAVLFDGNSDDFQNVQPKCRQCCGSARTVLPKNEPILIHNVDIFSNADLAGFYERNKENAVTLLVSKRDTSRYLLFDDNNELVGWTNIKTGEVRTPYEHLEVSACHPYAFSGIHLFSPSVFSLMDAFPEKFPIMDFYLSVCNKIKIKADVQNNLKLLDVGKQDSLKAAENFLSTL